MQNEQKPVGHLWLSVMMAASIQRNSPPSEPFIEQPALVIQGGLFAVRKEPSPGGIPRLLGANRGRQGCLGLWASIIFRPIFGWKISLQTGTLAKTIDVEREGVGRFLVGNLVYQAMSKKPTGGRPTAFTSTVPSRPPPLLNAL